MLPWTPYFESRFWPYGVAGAAPFRDCPESRRVLPENEDTVRVPRFKVQCMFYDAHPQDTDEACHLFATKELPEVIASLRSLRG